jgi:haloalkane dehalogenase
MASKELSIQRDQYRIYAQEYAGEEPTIILMHGMPDNLHLYDRLVPFLSPPRRVIPFDFLGWGTSDKPVGYPYTAENQTGDLDAVITQLRLDQVVLVAHDASGPPAIDWALSHSDQVAALILLNTYYCSMPELRPPEAIFLFSQPFLRNVARFFDKIESIDRNLYFWQVGRFIRNDQVRKEFVPFLYQQFRPARPAFFRLNEDLLPTLRARLKKIPLMQTFSRPVRIIFGDADPYLNKDVAKRFHELFPTSDLFLLPGARHFVQVDEPEEVAQLILSVPTTNRRASQADGSPD